MRQRPLGGCSCDTPATDSKLQKEPRQKRSYTLQRDRGGVASAPFRYPSPSFCGPGRVFLPVTEILPGKSPLKTTRARTPERGTPRTSKQKWTLAKWTVRASQLHCNRAAPLESPKAQKPQLKDGKQETTDFRKTEDVRRN